MSPEDQAFWASRLEKASEEMRINILNLFRELPEHIGWFRMMQEKKDAVFASGDNKAWQDIIEEEKKYLETITKQS